MGKAGSVQSEIFPGSTSRNYDSRCGGSVDEFCGRAAKRGYLPFYSASPAFGGRIPFFFCATNLILGIFNLIPIPPLDGSRIVMGILPENLVPAYLRLESFGFIIIFALLFLGVLDYVIYPIYHLLIRWLLPVG